jgi:tetratricopeptide (TPR) repeat protein
MNRRIHAQAASRSIFSGAAFWIALFAVVAIFGLSNVMLRAESASSFYKRGQNAEEHEDYDAAFNNFQKAYNKAPKDLRYRAALYRIRASASAMHMNKGNKLLSAGNEQEALVEFLPSQACGASTANWRPPPRSAFPRRRERRSSSTRWESRPYSVLSRTSP